MPDIALFPIPNVIAFPGMTMPLHVFEPRYRAMIDDSVDTGRMIGVCHTKKEIRPAPSDQSVPEALTQNQATYQPHEVFSAGKCDIVERMPDGRILINIDVQARYTVKEEIQTLPYRIVKADQLDDEPPSEDLQPLCAAIQDLLLSLITAKNPEVAAQIKGERWTALSPEVFSFKVFQVLQLEPDLMQSLLASTNTQQRLEHIHTIVAYHKQASDQ